MVIICSVLFCTASIVHLVFCAQENDTYRKATKPLLMPLLALTTIAALAPFLSASRSTLLLTVLALMFGFAGDILLINKSKTKVLLGTGFFFIGHALWIAQYIESCKSFSIWVYAVAAICYIIAIALVHRIIGKPKGALCFGFIVYASALCLLNFTGIAAVHAYKTVSALFYAIGSLFFIASDTMLARTLLKSKFPKSRFLIMATYITAQTLLTCGVVLPYFHL
ncbi:MAG: lysoplasmalogenase [Treponema sp.]|nr:lysoplasmalogenase [Treponema sp.]